jgi:transcriptional regulator with XRE-family HTH domain
MKAKRIKEKLYPATPPNLAPGQVVRIAREMLEMSQNDLSKKSGMTQATISGIEMGKIKIGLERAKILAAALHLHPSVILFGNWEEDKKRYLTAA